MVWIDELNLHLDEKVKLKEILSKNILLEVEFTQNSIYLFLEKSKTIILRNSKESFYFELKQKIEKSYEKIKSVKKVEDWHVEEEEYLYKNYYIDSLTKISKDLNKSYYQISLKVIEMGMVKYKKWSTEEKEYLEKNIGESNYILAQRLKRSIHSIKSKKKILEMLKEG